MILLVFLVCISIEARVLSIVFFIVCILIGPKFLSSPSILLIWLIRCVIILFGPWISRRGLNQGLRKNVCIPRVYGGLKICNIHV